VRDPGSQALCDSRTSSAPGTGRAPVGSKARTGGAFGPACGLIVLPQMVLRLGTTRQAVVSIRRPVEEVLL